MSGYVGAGGVLGRRPLIQAPARRGWIDPLAGIVFSLRLQTHRGDGVPLGLYQDTACTVPATQEGDSIAAWRDELSGSGLAVVQANAMKRPVLHYVNGVPQVHSDGVDDFMEVTLPNYNGELSWVIGGRIDGPTQINCRLASIGPDNLGPDYAGAESVLLVNAIFDGTGCSLQTYKGGNPIAPYFAAGATGLPFSYSGRVSNSSFQARANAGAWISAANATLPTSNYLTLFCDLQGSENVRADTRSIFLMRRFAFDSELAKIEAYDIALRP